MDESRWIKGYQQVNHIPIATCKYCGFESFGSIDFSYLRQREEHELLCHPPEGIYYYNPYWYYILYSDLYDDKRFNHPIYYCTLCNFKTIHFSWIEKHVRDHGFEFTEWNFEYFNKKYGRK